MEKSPQDTATDAAKTQEQESTSTQPVIEGKKFSQEEIDVIIQARLAREREKYADYDDLKKYKKEVEESKLSENEKVAQKLAELDKYQAMAGTRGDLLEKLLEAQLEGVPEDKRSLLPEAFTVEQKLDYLLANKDYFLEKKELRTPNDSKPKESSTKGLYGGKYETLDEWAQNDPIGYKKSRNKSGGNFF